MGSYAAPQMSYVPQATYGGYPGAATHSPYLDEKTIKQQETDATAALDGQAAMQTKMLDHQYSQQKENQFKQQRDQALMALDQQQKQQEMQLNMAKQQRLMAITQQAASMTAQAQQYKLQMDMQQKMATLYSGAGKTATTGTTEKKAATTKKA